MRTITLLCSAHRENGLCNAKELLRIIQTIQPEVVFEEIRPSDLEAARMQAGISTLEAAALARYRELRPFRRVPVDRYDVSQRQLLDLKRQLDIIFDHVEQKSPLYQLLNDELDERTRQQGFKYLNDHACESAMTKLANIEDEVIHATGDQNLTHWLSTWRCVNVHREREMVRTIYEFCRESAFDTGIFIVGAGHKAGISREIERRASSDAALIDWRLRP